MKSILTGLLGLLLTTSGAWASTVDLADNTFSAVVYSSSGSIIGPIIEFDETVAGVTFNFVSIGARFREVGTWSTGTKPEGPFHITIGEGAFSVAKFTLISSADVTLSGFWGLDQIHNVHPIFDVTGSGVSSTGNAFDVEGFPDTNSQTLNSFAGGILTILAGEIYTFDVTNASPRTRGYLTGLEFDIVDPSPVPLPASLPLFAVGLGIMGYFGSRRKRKSKTA